MVDYLTILINTRKTMENKINTHNMLGYVTNFIKVDKYTP